MKNLAGYARACLASYRRRKWLIFAYTIMAATISEADIISSNISAYVSLSVLWGQGAAGISYRTGPKSSIHLEESFVLDNGYEPDYFETSLYLRQNNRNFSFFEGAKYITEKYNDAWVHEQTPFLGFFHAHPSWLTDFYHQLEYRSRDFDDDYWRMENRATLYWPKRYGEYKLQPYTAYSIFTDLREPTVLEKSRWYVGVRFSIINSVRVRVYYVEPFGDTGNEWDDRQHFGLSASIFY